MTTIYHRPSNSLIEMDDATLAADVALVLDVVRLAQQPAAVALVAEAGASLGYASEDVEPTIALVREAQAILAAHAGRVVER